VASHTIRECTVSRPNEGIRVASVGNLYRFLVTTQATNGAYAMLELTVPPGKGGPFHIHTREEEAFYVLEGQMAFYTETERILAGSGTFINFPVHTIRGFRNESEHDVRMLAVLAPGGLEQMWLEEGIGILLTDAAQSAPAVEPGASECPSNAQRYGVEILPRELPARF